MRHAVCAARRENDWRVPDISDLAAANLSQAINIHAPSRGIDFPVNDPLFDLGKYCGRGHKVGRERPPLLPLEPVVFLTRRGYGPCLSVVSVILPILCRRKSCRNKISKTHNRVANKSVVASNKAVDRV